MFFNSHHIQDSRSIIGSVLKILGPTTIISVLNASPTFVERRLFDWLSNSNPNETEISFEPPSTGTLHSKSFPHNESFNATMSSNDSTIGPATDEQISNQFQQLVNEYLIFNIIQVFTLTLIPCGLLIYYNIRIFEGVIARQKLLIPREKIFNQKLKEKEKGRKKEYDDLEKTTIEEFKTTSDRNVFPFTGNVKCYPTIGTFKHTTDLLTLPVTLPGIDIDEQYSNSTQRSSTNSLPCGASNKRQYEDKLAFDNMVRFSY